jgi:hypothetical protein
MNPNDDIDPKDDFLCCPPCERPAGPPMDLGGSSDLEAPSGALPVPERLPSEGQGPSPARLGTLHDVPVRADEKLRGGANKNGVDASAAGGYRPELAPEVAVIGVDWMGAPDDGHEPAAGERQEEAGANAAPEQPAEGAVKTKRAYGRAQRPAPPPPTLLPHPHKPDMFPAFMARSALFSAIRANTGGSHHGPLQAPTTMSLSLQGPRLSMADKRVWEALVRAAKRGRVDMAAPFDVAMGNVAEMAGFGRGQTRSAWAAVERLAAAKVDALVNGVPVVGRLLASATKDGRRRVVAFDAKFMEAAFARVLNVDMTGSLRGRSEPPLAQWLGDYFQTHEPFATDPDLDYLRKLCGHGGTPKDFVSALEAAMAALAAARPDLIAAWSIDKSKGSSLEWTLVTPRGDARPSVKHPRKPKAGGPSTAASVAAAAAARRRGPAL